MQHGEANARGGQWCTARLQQPPCAGRCLLLRGALLVVAQHLCSKMLDFKMRLDLERLQLGCSSVVYSLW